MTDTKTPSMHPSLTFHHCPNCGHPRKVRLEYSIACEACDYLFYLNPAVAAAGLILNEKNQMLFIVRGKNPAKGRWALVGGFVDCGESPEKALKRECQEEVGITIDAPSYLACYPNTYRYKSMRIPCSICFSPPRSAHRLSPWSVTEKRCPMWNGRIHGVLIRLSSPSLPCSVH